MREWSLRYVTGFGEIGLNAMKSLFVFRITGKSCRLIFFSKTNLQ